MLSMYNSTLALDRDALAAQYETYKARVSVKIY